MGSMEKTLRHGQALTPFPELAFQGDLRPSQHEVVALARHKLASGAARRLHIAAPPGSGKTVLGLYIWALLAHPGVLPGLASRRTARGRGHGHPGTGGSPLAAAGLRRHCLS